jgi:hypothetical protein
MPYHGTVQDPRGGSLSTCHHKHRTLGAAQECGQRELRRNVALTTALDAARRDLAFREQAHRELSQRQAEREKAEAEQA